MWGVMGGVRGDGVMEWGVMGGNGGYEGCWGDVGGDGVER